MGRNAEPSRRFGACAETPARSCSPCCRRPHLTRGEGDSRTPRPRTPGALGPRCRPCPHPRHRRWLRQRPDVVVDLRRRASRGPAQPLRRHRADLLNAGTHSDRGGPGPGVRGRSARNDGSAAATGPARCVRSAARILRTAGNPFAGPAAGRVAGAQDAGELSGTPRGDARARRDAGTQPEEVRPGEPVRKPHQPTAGHLFLTVRDRSSAAIESERGDCGTAREPERNR